MTPESSYYCKERIAGNHSNISIPKLTFMFPEGLVAFSCAKTKHKIEVLPLTDTWVCGESEVNYDPIQTVDGR